MVVLSLCRSSPSLRSFGAQAAVSRKTITIRPDAKTGNRCWPCRELNQQRTPNPLSCRSRFGEILHCRGAGPHLSRRRHSASAKLRLVPLSALASVSDGTKLVSDPPSVLPVARTGCKDKLPRQVEKTKHRFDPRHAISGFIGSKR